MDEHRRPPEVTGFFHEDTNSVWALRPDRRVRRRRPGHPVLDFDRNARATRTDFADRMLDFVRGHALEVEWILDTHPHADHLSATHYLKERLGRASVATGDRVTIVQRMWKEIYNLTDFPADGSQWDRLFKDGERFRVGGIEAEAIFSPGHTAASMTYRIGDAAFVHDTLLMPDSGTARADFPGGDARALWRSVRLLLAMPPETRIFTGHDYMPGGREPRWMSSVAEQRACNIHVHDGISEEEFVRRREERDAGLPLPALMLDALQVNLRGGRLPEPEANGTSYLKIPLNRFPPCGT